MPDVFIHNTKNQPQTKAVSFCDSGEDHTHPFASFCTNAVHTFFQNQEPNEKIVLLLRRHPITNIPWISTSLILLIVPVLVQISGVDMSSLLSFLPDRFLNIVLFFYYLVVLNYAFVNFITWYYNVFLVSEKRIVDIDFSDILYHNVAVTKLSLVEDVNYTQVGFIRSLFDYGDVFVQTAGEAKNFEALAVPNPAQATNIILNLIGRRRDE